LAGVPLPLSLEHPKVNKLSDTIMLNPMERRVSRFTADSMW